MELRVRNVNQSFRVLTQLFFFATEEPDKPLTRPFPQALGKELVTRRPSRYGEVYQLTEPLTLIYTRPSERVLFNAARDANPFLHLYEALWCLAGRNDVAPLAYYCKRMSEFSDDGGVLNGAYGYRWRSHPRRSDEDECEEGPVDQLDLLVHHLKENPDSRRAVLQMWNVEDDLLKLGLHCDECGVWHAPSPACPGHGGARPSKDVCCNLSVLFSLREGLNPRGEAGPYRAGDELRAPPRLLDVTVLNRSNDLVWGLCGANAVQFSILQEYVAARLGAGVGLLRHFTNNLHVYTNNWKPEEWLAEGTSGLVYESWDDYWKGVALVKDPAAFDRELPLFVEDHADSHWLSPGYRPRLPYDVITEPFLRDVAYPLCVAHHWYRAVKAGWEDQGDVGDALSNVAADDWRIAATAWVDRRRKKEVTRVGA